MNCGANKWTAALLYCVPNHLWNKYARVYNRWFFFYNVIWSTYVIVLSTLHWQAQMRDLSGFVETRQQLLTLKPNHRMNWIGFSVSHHLNSKYDMYLCWFPPPSCWQLKLKFVAWWSWNSFPLIFSCPFFPFNEKCK
jgi:hypothetical protein